jgi:hypothetical protein
MIPTPAPRDGGRDIFTRFWGHVNKAGAVVRPELGPCWEWIGKLDKDGYGRFLVHRKVVLGHRWIWAELFGATDLCILHRCDNRICVRPAHLFKGTRAENMADKVAKGRQAIGAQYPQAVLNEAKVREIRRLRATGITIREVAEAVGVNPGTTYDVIRGRRWVHVA